MSIPVTSVSSATNSGYASTLARPSRISGTSVASASLIGASIPAATDEVSPAGSAPRSSTTTFRPRCAARQADREADDAGAYDGDIE